MTPEAAVRARLVGDPAVSGLVGSRVYPLILPQTVALPAITYQRISGQRDHTFTGPSSLARARVQIDAWATSYGEAKAVADAVRRSLAHFRDDTVQAALIGTDRDLYEPDTKTFRVSSDQIVLFEED